MLNIQVPKIYFIKNGVTVSNRDLTQTGIIMHCLGLVSNCDPKQFEE